MNGSSNCDNFGSIAVIALPIVLMNMFNVSSQKNGAYSRVKFKSDYFDNLINFTKKLLNLL